jgi:uncharacterized protein YbjQ (UPF0145 family)
MTARPSATWGSGLTADEFAAVRSVGFEPVGQVFGAAVYGVGPLGYTCPANVRPNGDPAAPATPRSATQVSGRREAGSFGPLVQARYQARDQAIGRMTAECRDLGGHGVVGVQVSRGAFLAGGVQFTATGTAVRAPGAGTGPRMPFASGLTGQDFAKLLMTGWVPAGLVLGISIGSRHDDRDTTRQVRWTAGNTEVAGWTELVNESRRDARPATQHAAGPTLTIMSLDPQRRQTARIRI